MNSLNNTMNTATPVITVVIPAYNAESYVAETLQSLGSQTNKSFEVIVVDDHSTDNTVAVASKVLNLIGLVGMVVVRPEGMSKGVSNCRNYGIQIASGDWISFLDSDDIFYPKKIEETIGSIDLYGEKCSAFFHGARQFEDGSGVTLATHDRTGMERPEWITEDIFKQNFITTATVTLRKKLINEIGLFDSALHGVEDYMMWMRISKRSPWYYNPEILTDYRVRKQSLMGGRKMSYYVIQNKNLFNAAKNTGEFTSVELTTLQRYLFTSVMQHYANESINRYGWADFLKGIGALIFNGYAGVAFRILGNKLKVETLRKTASVIRKNKTNSPK